MNAILPVLAMLVVTAAAAHDAPHALTARKAVSAEQHPWGHEGVADKATRVVRVDMSDAMRFTPAEVTVRQGDTVRFEVSNSGKVLHEMVIGTREALEKHAELMRRFPGMEHDEPYMAHVSPGKSGTIAWTFDRPGEFMYGCLVPGHWEAGMQGRIHVQPTERKSK